jgi:glycosyltransferase involved in cell wall biosynthesis
VRQALAEASVVVAPTAAFLDELATRYGPFRDARVVPSGIRDDGVLVAPKEPFVLGAGRVWDQAKNLAMLDVVAERIPWPVQIAGDPHHPSGRWVSTRRATLLGPVSHAVLADRMARAAIVCHPARYEPFGLVPLEAAASGCALVLGDLPTLREVWGNAALYAPPDDADAVVAQLRRLIYDEPLRCRLGAEAHVRARSFRIDTQARTMLALYRELVMPALAEAG